MHTFLFHIAPKVHLSALSFLRILFVASNGITYCKYAILWGAWASFRYTLHQKVRTLLVQSAPSACLFVFEFHTYLFQKIYCKPVGIAARFDTFLVHFTPKLCICFSCHVYHTCTKDIDIKCTFGALCSKSVHSLLVQCVPKVYEKNRCQNILGPLCTKSVRTLLAQRAPKVYLAA